MTNKRPELEKEAMDEIDRMRAEALENSVNAYNQGYKDGVIYGTNRNQERRIRLMERVQWWKLFVLMVLACSLSLTWFTYLLTLIR